MSKDNSNLQRAFKAARRRDILRALQGREVTVELRGKALTNLAMHNFTYRGDEKALVETMLLVNSELLAGPPLEQEWEWIGKDTSRYIIAFASSTAVVTALAMLLGTGVDPLAVRCMECDEWFRPDDYYDLTEHRGEFYLCYGCVVAMTGEDLIEYFL